MKTPKSVLSKSVTPKPEAKPVSATDDPRTAALIALYDAGTAAAKAQLAYEAASDADKLALEKLWDEAKAKVAAAETAVIALWDQAVSAIEKARDEAGDLIKELEGKLSGVPALEKACADAVDTANDLRAKLAEAEAVKNTPPSDDQGGTGNMAGPAGGLETITVIGPAKGRRRAGFTFGPEPVTVQVTASQKAVIEGDASLSMSVGGAPRLTFEATASHMSVDEFFVGGVKVAMVKVLGPARGHRRAGFQFGAVAQSIEVNRAQLALLLADPALSVAPAA